MDSEIIYYFVSYYAGDGISYSMKCRQFYLLLLTLIMYRMRGDIMYQSSVAAVLDVGFLRVTLCVGLDDPFTLCLAHPSFEYLYIHLYYGRPM